MQKRQARDRKSAPQKAVSEGPANVAVEEERPAGKSRPASRNRAGGSSAKKDRAGEQIRELVQELEKVRSVLVDVVDQYRERLTTQLGTLKEILESNAFKESEITSMLDEIRSVRLKPDKGRVKDLERLQYLVKHLGKRLPERP